MSRVFWTRWGPYYPPFEFSKFKKIDFFPASISWEKIRSICVGTKSRSLGDALILSTLPKKIRKLHPHVQIDIYPRGFNRGVFFNNPQVDGVDYLPSSIFGDDCNSPGKGHLIQLKEQWFGLPVSEDPKPEIYLTPSEIQSINHSFSNDLDTTHKKLCILHPWGKTRTPITDVKFWKNLVQKFQDRFHFWQVGTEGNVPIPGCHTYFLFPRSYRHCRKLFALFRKADIFLGVDSGPMHVARAFDIPSMIFINHEESSSPNPHSLGSFLYPTHTHLHMLQLNSKELWRKIDEFLKA